MNIRNLNDLREHASSDAITRIVIEYLMETQAKSNKLDEISGMIDKGCSLRDIKEVI